PAPPPSPPEEPSVPGVGPAVSPGVASAVSREGPGVGLASSFFPLSFSAEGDGESEDPGRGAAAFPSGAVVVPAGGAADAASSTGARVTKYAPTATAHIANAATTAKYAPLRRRGAIDVTVGPWPPPEVGGAPYQPGAGACGPYALPPPPPPPDGGAPYAEAEVGGPYVPAGAGAP
ncbi:hypothetical protein PV379_49490, partial [Streptomyces caniscabiei]|nr:hypothetical protein [Streptomyces caniscabiei]